MLSKLKYIFSMLMIFYSSLAVSIDSDKDKPIFLESDSAKWDENSQKSTYRGNVVVTQGTMLLTGDLLVVTSKNNEINNMVITGKKSTYKQKTQSGKIVNGEAYEIQYFVENSKIIFLNNAVAGTIPAFGLWSNTSIFPSSYWSLFAISLSKWWFLHGGL